MIAVDGGVWGQVPSRPLNQPEDSHTPRSNFGEQFTTAGM
jgi:hypothetical protein